MEEGFGEAPWDDMESQRPEKDQIPVFQCAMLNRRSIVFVSVYKVAVAFLLSLKTIIKVYQMISTWDMPEILK